MSTHAHVDRSSAARPDPLAAVLLAAPALLMLGLVRHHPVLPPAPPGGRALPEMANAMVRLGPALGFVHGAILVLLAAQTLGFHRFSTRLGWRRLAVAAAFLAYAGGVALVAVPALLDGFVLPDLAAACVRGAAQTLQACGPGDGATFRLVSVLIQVFTKAGLILMAAADAGWGLALLTEPRSAVDGIIGDGRAFRRVVGVAGLACAAVPVGVLAGADVRLGPGSLAALLVAPVAWALLAAASCVHRPVGASRAARSTAVVWRDTPNARRLALPANGVRLTADA